MFLLEPEPTPYDLHWWMFGIHVRVHPLFWLITAILGWNAVSLGVEYLLLWIACVFVSILVHELGHVVVGQFFGARGHIILYSFGGLAVGSSALANRWQRIAVYLAGPFAGFLFLGLVLLLSTILLPPRPSLLAQIAIWHLTWINLIWGIVNLFPIFPLDGGQISRDLFDGFMPGNGIRVSLAVSAVTAGLVGIGLLISKPEMLYSAIFFLLLAVSSYQALQQQPPPPSQRWD